MRCVITGNSVKVFAKAIHCLAKIGEEIYLEALTKGLSLRTVNSSRSAYACFLFAINFFQSYDDSNPSSNGDGTSEDGLKCKLSVKSCLSVFKSLGTIERIVDRCSIKMDLEEESLIFLLYCRHGITKTYNLGYQDCESLQAVFSKNLCPNVIKAQPRIFSEVIMNFQNTQEEITLSVCPQDMKVTNYVDDETDLDKIIHTEMVLVPEEFDNYQIGVDTEITFCLKELKGILSFAESSGQPMDLHFECGGKPIVFSLSSDSTFEANFVLATLIDQPTSSQPSQRTNNKTENPRQKTQTKESQSSNHDVVQHGDDEFELEHEEEDALAEVVHEEMTKEMSRGETSKGVNGSHGRSENRGSQLNNTDIDDEDFFGDSFPYQDLFTKKSKTTLQKQTNQTQDDREKRNETYFSRANPVHTPPSFVSTESSMKYTEMPFLGGTISADSENSPGIAVRSGNNKDGKKHDEKHFSEEKFSEESVPGTPPSKKFKSMFFSSMSESADDAHNKTTIDHAVILAADTDEESD